MTDTVTPNTVLDFWIGPTAKSAEALKDYSPLWFQKSFETDRTIAETYTSTLAALAQGEAKAWAKQGPRERLAAIIVLDQFSRNIFRGHRLAFKHDPLARELAETGLAFNEDRMLSETERVFFYLPLEHSESLEDQKHSVQLFEQLQREARPDFKPFCGTTLDYARQHYDVIEKYGRFPHRNSVLRRASTQAEKEYLSQPGAGF